MRSSAVVLAASAAAALADGALALAPQPDYDRVLGRLDGSVPKTRAPSAAGIKLQNAVRGLSDRKQGGAKGARGKASGGGAATKGAAVVPSLPALPDVSLPSLDLGVLDGIPGGVPTAAVGLTSLALATRGSLVRSKKLREEAERKREEEAKKPKFPDFNKELPVYDVPSILRSAAVGAASDVGAQVSKTKVASNIASRTGAVKERADRLGKDLTQRASVVRANQAKLLKGEKVDLPKIDVKALKAPKLGTLPKPKSAAFKPKPAPFKPKPAVKKVKKVKTVYMDELPNQSVNLNRLQKVGSKKAQKSSFVRIQTVSDSPVPVAAGGIVAGLAALAATRSAGVSSSSTRTAVSVAPAKKEPAPSPPPAAAAPPKPAPVAPAKVTPKAAAPAAPVDVAPKKAAPTAAPEKAAAAKKVEPVVPVATPAAIESVENKPTSSLLDVVASNEIASGAVAASALALFVVGLRNNRDERQATEDSLEKEAVSAEATPVAATPVDVPPVEVPPVEVPPVEAPPAVAPPVEAPPAVELGELAKDIQGQLAEINSKIDSFNDEEVKKVLEGQKRDLEEMLKFAVDNDL